MEEYDSAKDAHDSYYAAVEAKRLRGLAAIRREVQIGSCRLILGDMNEVLPALGAFDLCLTDPPYGIGEDGGRFRARKGQHIRVLPKGNWDSTTPPQSSFDLMLSCSKEQIIWGGNYFTDKLPPSKGWLYWQKLMGGDFSDGELAWTSRDRALREFTFCNKVGGKVHPTQKPVEVMKWCLGFAPDASTVVDPYMGSGTSGVACVQMGKSFVGIERHEPYFEIACRGVQEAVNTPDMFIETARVPEPTQEAFL
jgi:DNA modification methylase